MFDNMDESDTINFIDYILLIVFLMAVTHATFKIGVVYGC